MPAAVYIRKMVTRYSTRTSAEAHVMLITVCRLHDSRPGAHPVIVALKRAGVPASDTSVISNDCDTWYRGPADR